MENKFNSVILSYNQTTSCSKQYYIYIITNYNNTAIYTGLASSLIKQIFEHKNKLV